jgi:signal transduction histidine kinase
MKRLWQKISHYPGLSEDEDHTYRNFNFFLIFGLFDIIIVLLALKDVDPSWPFYVCLSEFCFFLLMMLLHTKGYFETSRFITFLLTIVLQVVASLAHGPESGFDYILLILCVMPLLFLENPKLYGAIFILSLSSLLTIRYLYQDIEPIIRIGSHFPFYWNIFFTGSILFLAMYIFKAGYQKQQDSLKEQNRLILAQKEEMEQINNNLENIVSDRTSKIEHQKQQFRELANINAHKVRSPLARIQGLLNLVEIEANPEKSLTEFLPKLKSNAEELDGVLKEVNKTLHDIENVEKNFQVTPISNSSPD